jgi:hypothetical protein
MISVKSIAAIAGMRTPSKLSATLVSWAIRKGPIPNRATTSGIQMSHDNAYVAAKKTDTGTAGDGGLTIRLTAEEETIAHLL